MGELVTYRTRMVDSSRWARFAHRPGDIVISTPPKSGTTWTQMLCALMIFDGPDFPDKLDAIAPWLDLRIRSEQEVLAIYERQTHRRFFKTHTPLDGLALHPDVHYLVVGRDPRDVLVSSEHHGDNMDRDVMLRHRIEAEGDDGLADQPPPAAETDPAVRFRNFVEGGRGPDEPLSLAKVLHHLDTGWQRRNEPNVGMFHYRDYQADLVSEMVRISDLCDLGLPIDRLRQLAPEASLERMRGRADEVVPDIAKSAHWKDPARFFRAGGSGEWFERTTPEDRARYDERVGELVGPDLARWVHVGGR